MDAATDVVASRAHKPTIVATHHNPPVWDDIQANKIAASPTDWTALQGRMAIDMMVRILNGEKPGADMPFRAGPIIKVMTHQNLSTFSYEDNFGPKGFQPVFNVSPGS
jgi:periplasmic protein TorT